MFHQNRDFQTYGNKAIATFAHGVKYIERRAAHEASDLSACSYFVRGSEIASFD